MFHQVPTEWEVVDAYAVEPVRVYVEDHGATIVRLAPHEIVGAYTFDMAPSPPVRPAYKKRHSNDGSTSKSSSDGRNHTTSRRGSHLAARPDLHDHQSAPASVPIQHTTSPTTLPASNSSPSSSPNLTRLGSAFCFFRTHTNAHPRPDQRRRSSSPSSTDGSLSGSGSGSSDGDSEAVPRRHLFGRRRQSDRFTKSPESTVSTNVKKPTPTENPAYRKADLKKALVFARGELMKQVEASGKNALVLEGWSVTVLRQAARYRIRIEYTGRPAIISYSEESPVDVLHRVPPFLEVIDDH